MFRFVHLRDNGDATANYDITLDREYTVQEFIITVLANRPREWGYIGIRSNSIDGQFLGDPRMEYRRGTILSALPNDILSKKIKSVSASGGWSNMDYLLTLEG